MENKLKESPVELLWKKEIEGCNSVSFSDNNIVVGTKDGWVICFDLGGNLVWKNRMNYEYLFSLPSKYKKSLKEGKVDDALKKAFKDNLCELNLPEIFKKEKNFWEIIDDRAIYKIEELNEELKVYINTVFVGIVKEDIIVGIKGSYMYIFDTNGKIKSKWSNAIYVSDNYVLEKKVDNEGFSCFSLFDKNKNLIWKDKIRIKHVSAIDLSDEYIAIGTCGVDPSYPWRIYLFNKNGELKWKYETDDEVEGIRILDGKYIAVSAGDFYLLDIDGKVIIDDEVEACFSNIWNGYIATSSQWIELYLLDINKRKLKWRWEIYRAYTKEDLPEDIEKYKYDNHSYVIRDGTANII